RARRRGRLCPATGLDRSRSVFQRAVARGDLTRHEKYCSLPRLQQCAGRVAEKELLARTPADAHHDEPEAAGGALQDGCIGFRLGMQRRSHSDGIAFGEIGNVLQDGFFLDARRRLFGRAIAKAASAALRAAGVPFTGTRMRNRLFSAGRGSSPAVSTASASLKSLARRVTSGVNVPSASWVSPRPTIIRSNPLRASSATAVSLVATLVVRCTFSGPGSVSSFLIASWLFLAATLTSRLVPSFDPCWSASLTRRIVIGMPCAPAISPASRAANFPFRESSTARRMRSIFLTKPFSSSDSRSTRFFSSSPMGRELSAHRR